MNFFGLYLVQRGHITQEALANALAYQEECNRRIGEVAVEHGYLNEKQVESVFEEQREVDEPFGTIALRRGFLTRDQLDDLLFAQTVHTTHLGEALLVRGHISPEQFSAVLMEYAQYEAKRSRKLKALLAGIAHGEILAVAVRALERAFLRFVGEGVKIDQACPRRRRDSYEFHCQVTYRAGDQGGDVAVSVFLPKGLCERIAKEMHGDAENRRETFEGKVLELMTIFERYLRFGLQEQGLLFPHGLIAGRPLTEAVAAPDVPGACLRLETVADPLLVAVTQAPSAA